MDNANRTPRGETPASPQGRPAAETTFSQKLADFLRKNRMQIFVACAAIIVAIAGLAIFSSVKAARINASTQRLEKLTDELAAWSAEQDAGKKTELEKALIAGLDELIAAYPRHFAAQRALTMRARLAEEKKDWAAAQKDWTAAAEGFPKSYLAPIALHNAAVTAEEAGNLEEATKLYQRLVDGYTGKTVGISHAYFSLGRLAEGAKDFKGALAQYEKLSASYPDDDWTKLAKDRIIFIKSQGLNQ